VIIDASAIIAILRNEPDASRFALALASQNEAKMMSAANYVEAAAVIDTSRDPNREAADSMTYLRRPRRRSTLSPPFKPASPAKPIETSARGAASRLDTTSAIASLMRYPMRRASRCCSRARTFREPTCGFIVDRPRTRPDGRSFDAN